MPLPTLTPEQRTAFIENLVPAAHASRAKWGVPESVTLAQGILESGWGQTRLALQCNNFFGIKAHDNIDYAEFSTTEYFKNAAGEEVEQALIARFAKYTTPEECFDDHGNILATHPRYAPAMSQKDDPQAFARALGPELRQSPVHFDVPERRVSAEHRCGYSTNPTYGAGLWKLITQYNLTQYATA